MTGGGIKVSDYIARRIAELGVRHVFMITGGGAMHLNDSIGSRDDFRFICSHHEQACAIGVEGYARVSGGIGVAAVTTGPGGTNTITGVLGQWHDSVPALYISGQVRYDTTVASTGMPLRQLGDQEADIVSIVGSITKYAVMVTDPLEIRYHFDKAVHLATSGRPGPVWLDVPLNVQGAVIDEAQLRPYEPAQEPTRADAAFDREMAAAQAAELAARLREAERPVFLAGSGIRTGGAVEQYMAAIDRMRIPVLTAWNAPDLMFEDHPLFCGRPSTIGDRGGNFSLQNSDLLVSVGCRLNIRQTGYEFDAFAREAFKAVVDIDPLELRKPTIRPDMAVHSDAGFFLEALADSLGDDGLPHRDEWLNWCRARRQKYGVVLPEYREESGHVNPYVFVDALSDALEPGDVIVTGNGAASVITFQAIRLKRGQRLIANSGTASMGYDLPAAIGACLANGGRRVICLAGDGSLQMNIQELQTLAHHQLPVKVFLFNNAGYLSIRQTQDNMFSSRYVGESAASGVSFPDFVRVADAYGLGTSRISSHDGLAEGIAAALDRSGPVLVDVVMPAKQLFAPKVASQRLPDGRIVSKPLEDMFPFLDRDEFRENMLVPEWDPER